VGHGVAAVHHGAASAGLAASALDAGTALGATPAAGVALETGAVGSGCGLDEQAAVKITALM